MYRVALLALCLAACTSAAPQFFPRHHGPPPPPPPPHYAHLHDYNLEDSLFDTSRFWSDFSREMRYLDRVLDEFYRHFPSSVNQEGIEDNQYVVKISLAGFEERDIVVKARQGVLMVQAVRKPAAADDSAEDNAKQYLDIRTLPTYVDPKGSWTYENDMLKIVFPIGGKATTEASEVEAVTTQRAEHSREEMEPASSEERVPDADVGLQRRGDQAPAAAAAAAAADLTTTTSAPDATTYAVDLTNEIEFVPIRY